MPRLQCPGFSYYTASNVDSTQDLLSVTGSTFTNNTSTGGAIFYTNCNPNYNGRVTIATVMFMFVGLPHARAQACSNFSHLLLFSFSFPPRNSTFSGNVGNSSSLASAAANTGPSLSPTDTPLLPFRGALLLATQLLLLEQFHFSTPTSGLSLFRGAVFPVTQTLMSETASALLSFRFYTLSPSRFPLISVPSSKTFPLLATELSYCIRLLSLPLM